MGRRQCGYGRAPYSPSISRWLVGAYVGTCGLGGEVGIGDLLCRCAQCCIVTFPSQRELTMTMAMGSCRHGILRGADSCRGIAHINESLSDVNDIDDGEPVFGSYDDELRMIARLRHCASAVSLNRTSSGALCGTNRSLCSCAWQLIYLSAPRVTITVHTAHRRHVIPC